MNRDSMKKLMDLIDDPELKETMSRIDENLDRVDRVRDQRQNPYAEKTRVKNLQSSLKEAMKAKVAADAKGIGLILTGGGAKGSYQAGGIKRLGELAEKISIRGIAGTSAGALNGAMVAGGDSLLPEKMWTNLDHNRIAGKDGFFSLSGENDRYLEELIRDSGILADINMESPLVSATALDTQNGHPKDFILNDMSDEEKISCLLASAAFPIAMKEQEIGGISYIDGGFPLFGSNMPIAPLYHLGFRRFIVLHCSSRRESSDWADFNRLGIDINQESYFNGAVFVHCYASRDLGGLFQGTTNFSPDYIKTCIELGYQDMRKREKDFDILKEDLGPLDEIHVVDGERCRTFKKLLEIL